MEHFERALNYEPKTPPHGNGMPKQSVYVGTKGIWRRYGTAWNKKMVPEVGLEPTLCCQNWILNKVRL